MNIHVAEAEAKKRAARIGLAIAVRPEDESTARTILEAGGETVYSIGSIEAGSGLVRVD